MNIEFQQVAFMALIVILLFVLAHYVRKWSAPKIETHDELKTRQLVESLYKAAEYESAAGEAMALSKFHKERAKKLMQAGYVIPDAHVKKLAAKIANGGHQMPPLRPPPSPPNPTRSPRICV